jgi:DNA repair photolyase
MCYGRGKSSLCSSAGILIAFQNEQLRRLFETGAPPNEQRIAALKALKEVGVSTHALICPVTG